MVYEPAQRIAGFKPYFFAALNQRLAELKAKGMDIIRIDMGSPDLPPADFIIDRLYQAAKRPDAHGYTPNGGTPAFKRAMAEYYGRRFGVELDPGKGNHCPDRFQGGAVQPLPGAGQSG